MALDLLVEPLDLAVRLRVVCPGRDVSYAEALKLRLEGRLAVPAPPGLVGKELRAVVGHDRGRAAVPGNADVQDGQRVGSGGLLEHAVCRQVARSVVLVRDEPPGMSSSEGGRPGPPARPPPLAPPMARSPHALSDRWLRVPTANSLAPPMARSPHALSDRWLRVPTANSLAPPMARSPHALAGAPASAPACALTHHHFHRAAPVAGSARAVEGGGGECTTC